MSVRMLSRPVSTSANTSVSSTAPLTISSQPSIPVLSSSPGSPSSPTTFSFPPPLDLTSQRSLSPPAHQHSASGAVAATSSLNFISGGQLSCSTSSSSSSGSGSTSISSPALSASGASGVVVVGVIGRVENEVSQLLDRLLDAQVFGLQQGEAAERWSRIDDRVPELHTNNAWSRDKDQVKDIYNLSREYRSREQDFLGDDSFENEGLMRRGFPETFTFLDDKNETKMRGNNHDKIESAKIDTKKEGRTMEYIGEGEEAVKFGGERQEGVAPWLLNRVKHYHEKEKGIVYVQFTWGSLPLEFLKMESSKLSGREGAGAFSAALEQQEGEGLRGLLFMFSVCHVILLVQEGARFDPRFLRNLRLLQAAKHSLAPFVKTQVLPGLLPPPLSTTRPSPLRPISLATSNGSGRSGVGRNSSTIALMSGSTPVLFPGQCTPVLLFVCLEDLPEPTAVVSQHLARSEDGIEASISQGGPSSQSGPSNYGFWQAPHVKAVISVATMTRPNSKPELSLRKKLQTSMEAQIRFLLKKCRTVAGSGDAGALGSGVVPGMGPRSSSSSSSLQGVGGGALFVLDPSRAVVLLDRSTNRRTDALEDAVDFIEAMLLGKEGAESALGDSGGLVGEDIQAIKDFLWRQAEILRGKGGISNNSAAGSAGVGMVAAAAAAAAASAASGGSGGTNKPLCNPPELPTLPSWLSACRVLAEALSGRAAEEVESDLFDRNPGSRVALKKGLVGLPKIATSGGTVRVKGTIDPSLACLENGSDMDLKFSSAWCKRVLPSVHDVYLKGLPPCYPTSLHKSQLEKALRVFAAMVRGPAVPLYAEKLKKDCEAVWHSGRQLCDAESLTGKPCMHQVHEVTEMVSSHSMNGGRRTDQSDMVKGSRDKRNLKAHSSGVVFLHACSCGRSRKLRKDPFDLESANVSFFRFPNCEDLLPSLVIPSADIKVLAGSSWSLVCLGASRYYQPSAGMVQIGFCMKQNYLSRWDIPVVYRRRSETIEDSASLSIPKDSHGDLLPVPPSKTLLMEQKKKMKTLLPRAQPIQESKAAVVNLYSKVTEKGFTEGTRNSSSRANAGVLDMKRALTDVATKANYGGEAAFPPLPQKHERLVVPPSKPMKQLFGKERKDASQSLQGEPRDPNTKVVVRGPGDKNHERLDSFESGGTEDDTDVKHSISIQLKTNPTTRTDHVRVYVGFEHECPHGHRFLLAKDQHHKVASSNVGIASSVQKQEGNAMRTARHNRQDFKDVHMKDTHAALKGPNQSSVSGQHASLKFMASPTLTASNWDQKIPEDMLYWSVQDGSGDGYSLLNSDLPIYMNCPHCKTVEDDKKSNNNGVVFGGTISQLQRIFLVTPPLPLLLASCPVVEFEDMTKPTKSVVKFKIGSEIILPPDRVLSLRLPFVYQTELEGVSHRPLLARQDQPELTAWLVKGTALYISSKGGFNGFSGG